MRSSAVSISALGVFWDRNIAFTLCSVNGLDFILLRSATRMI